MKTFQEPTTQGNINMTWFVRLIGPNDNILNSK